ncbi:uncharacterized protein LOC134716857 [Mytilus trossulus]|uniref:uncharacterized protein LOC134716857 n=1 Tax=Mytilus trossulus TaxID=6551 RepID=UPI0030053598
MSLSRYQASQRPLTEVQQQYLPFGKCFHIFFLYKTCESDCFSIRQIQALMEAKGFVCARHEEVFIPGFSIFQNIKDCLESSVVICVLLTQEFLKSQWCMKELNLAVMGQMKNENKQPVIVPMVSGVDESDIPECVSDYTYLELSPDTMDFALSCRLERTMMYAIANYKNDTEIALDMLGVLQANEMLSISYNLDQENEQMILSCCENYPLLKQVFGLDFRIEKHYFEHCSVFIINFIMNFDKFVFSKSTKVHDIISETWEFCVDSEQSDLSCYDFLENDTNILTIQIEIVHDKAELILFCSKPRLSKGQYVMPYKALVVSDKDSLQNLSEGNLFTFEEKNNIFHCLLIDSGMLPVEM